MIPRNARRIATIFGLLVPLSGCVLEFGSQPAEPAPDVFVSDAAAAAAPSDDVPVFAGVGNGHVASYGLTADVSAAAGQAAPLFRDWPLPDAVIVFSGQQHGHMKPCGCSPQFQKGGLARRHGFIETLRQKKWPLLLTELGGLPDDRSAQPVPEKYGTMQEQSQIKLRITLEALGQMGQDVLNIGPDDMSLPGGFFGLYGELVNPPRPRALSSNLAINKELDADGLVQPHVVKKLGPVRIAVTGVIGERFKDGVNDPDAKWQPPQQALRAIVPKMTQASDIQVLLLYAYLDEAKELAAKFPDLDVIIHGDRFDEPTSGAEWVNNNKTMLVTVGTMGKYAGAIGIFSRREPRLRYELVSLDDRFPETPVVKTLLDEDYLKELAALPLVENSPKRPFDPAMPDRGFVGSKRCQECHPRGYAKWLSTPHAHALETLVDGRHGKGKGTHVDPECVSCHTTGFLYKTGYDGTSKTQHLGANGCENCHGPGSKHVAVMAKIKANEAVDSNEEEAALKMMHAPKPRREKNLCSRCHDAENDPEFAHRFDERWLEIIHNKEADQDRAEQ